jgi:hypothetical protein
MTKRPAASSTPPLPPIPPLPPMPALLSVPAFWPMAMAKEAPEVLAKQLKFADEEIKIHAEARPEVATPHVVRLDLRTMVLRDYERPDGIPTLVEAPYAGHSAVIADYAKGQNLVETLLAGGIGHVALTDWKSATDDMKDFDSPTAIRPGKARRGSLALPSARSICWPARAMTLLPRSRCSTRKSTSERQKRGSRRNWFRAATSACSWDPGH